VGGGRTITGVSGHAFISYSHLDAEYVGRLKIHLAAAGLTVWTDEGIDYGAQWSAIIEKQIETCAAFVPVMTPRARDAPWVKREIDLAQELGKPILPLLLEGRRFFTLRDLQDENVVGGRLPSDRFIEHLRALTGPSSQTKARTVAEQRFLDALSDRPYRSALERIFDACDAAGLRFAWGNTGASIRMATPDRAEPLSIAWIFPEENGWQGLRHLCLGVDTQSLAATPTVEEAVLAYADAALAIAGARRASGIGLRVAIFEPEVVVKVESQLTALIAGLTTATKRLRKDQQTTDPVTPVISSGDRPTSSPS
jgi:hypothetical protein